MIIVIAMSGVLCSCQTLKFVPENRYLLDRVQVEVINCAEGKKARAELTSHMHGYLRQTPNTKFLGFWPLQLDIYSTAPKDTTTASKRRLRRNAFKMGEAPEIYDCEQTAASMREIEKAMANRGYFHATVDTVSTIHRRRVRLKYIIDAGEVYRIREYQAHLEQPDANRYANDANGLIMPGQTFSTSQLDKERERIATLMRNDGCYYYEKDVLDFTADSSWNNHQVSVRLKESEQMLALPDSIHRMFYQRMYISRIIFHQDAKNPLREKALRRRCQIREGELYQQQKVERTYAKLNGLEAIKYVEITFRQVAPDSLECHISLQKAKLNSISAELEGTYSAGDWGLMVEAGYTNRNIFRGAEQLHINARAGYEWRQNGGRAIEGRGEIGLRWPNSLGAHIGITYQNRPDEYSRTMADATLSYSYQAHGSRWRHTFNVVDINFIKMGFISEEYQKMISKTGLLSYRYQDNLVLAWNYTGFYSNRRQDKSLANYSNFRYSIETAGNALYGVACAAKLRKDEKGQYQVFGVGFTQYAKGEVDYAFHHIVAPKHELVYHIGAGVIMPYGNEKIAPFEKRYFSGGANSVRGWQSRSLGPGAFTGADGQMRYDLQTGDIKLDMNIEYRFKVLNFLGLAAFTDAGNIWTIRDYDAQPGGLFRIHDFYRQIAWSYGAGIRLDLSVLIFRMDLGVKLYDPTRLISDPSRVWRTAANHLSWNEGDFTFHFAIGYPF